MTDEALRRADGLLSELIEVVETARALPMSASCVLPRETVLDLLDELREVLPREIEEARSVIAARDRLVGEAQDAIVRSREQAVDAADAVLADADHRAEATTAEADRRAAETVEAARAEHGRLVSSTAVHQAAAAAAAALREDAERYQQQVAAEAHQYDTKVRGDADRYAHTARVDAERYATKLTADSEDYAERTLDELTAVLNRAAGTAEQGRAALAQRRAGHWVAEPQARPAQSQDTDDARRPPISA